MHACTSAIVSCFYPPTPSPLRHKINRAPTLGPQLRAAPPLNPCLATPQVKQVKGRWHIIVDYKQKWLPMRHHETQQDAFGKRGKSIFGAAVFRWSEATQELEVLNVRIACDDAHQNYYHTVQMIATTLDIVAEVWSDSSSDITATLQADGAGNFSGTATMILLPRTFLSRNVRLVRAVISEVGDGKNLVDTDFQQTQMSLDQRIAGGANVETAQEILDNLDANPTAGTANAASTWAAAWMSQPRRRWPSLLPALMRSTTASTTKKVHG